MADVVFNKVLCFTYKKQRFVKSTLLDIVSKFYHEDELYDAKIEPCKMVSALPSDVTALDSWSKFVNNKGAPVRDILRNLGNNDELKPKTLFR